MNTYDRRTRINLTQFYKIYHGHAPTYLRELLPRHTRDKTTYLLRNRNNLSLIKANTNQFSSSFIPLMTKAWNQLDETIRYIGSLSDFKRHLAKDDGKTPSYYYNGNRKSQILMSKLRMKCSQLDSHLYRHHLLESSACESCGHYAEDTEHYLFHCP